MKSPSPHNLANADEEKRFARFMIMCATTGSDPFQVGGVDAETLAKLQKQLHLRHNGEVLFLAEGVSVDPKETADRVLEQFAKGREEGIGWAFVPCFGEVRFQRVESGTITRSEPGAVSGPDGVVPRGVVVGRRTFKLRVIGIPLEELKMLAIELGRLLNETVVHIRRFNAENWETVSIG